MKIKVKYKLTAPTSHIGEVASTGSYFNMILTSSGKVPVITGNSVRGQIRDCCASYLLNRIGAKVNKEIFHVLFSGGNISGTMKDDVEKSRLIRQHFPMISLLGGGLGDMIMAGKSMFSFLYPVCRETFDITGVDSFKSWHEMLDEIEFTRTDDSKNDLKAAYLIDFKEESKAKVSTQMRFSVQYIAAGTEFVQVIDLVDKITDLEICALYSGILNWFQCPRLGGMAAKGFGAFDADVACDIGRISVSKGKIDMSESVKKMVELYNRFLDEEGNQYLELLEVKRGAGKSGKKTNSAD